MKPLLSLFSPAGADARLSVMIFHRVLPEPDSLFPAEVHAERFDQICGWLKTMLQVLPLDEAARRLREGTLPPRAAAITFDDGYADNHDLALPILKRHGLTATFFIATGFLDGGCMWNDLVIDAVRRTSRARLDLRGVPHCGDLQLPLGTLVERRAAIAAVLSAIKYLPMDERLQLVGQVRQRANVGPAASEMMRSAQVRALRKAGMQIGAHTVSHPILARLDAAAAREEIGRGRDVLQDIVQERVGLFAYPNGRPGTDYTPESVEVVRSLGFDAAVSTAWGSAAQATDPFQLPRFTPWDRSRLRFGVRLARNLRGPIQ